MIDEESFLDREAENGIGFGLLIADVGQFSDVKPCLYHENDSTFMVNIFHK
jgi:hypothetical protein